MAGPSTRLRLRVSPGARRSAIVGRHGDAWKVRIAAPPTEGRANAALLALLAEALELPATHLDLVSGSAGRDKVVLLRGIGEREARGRLEAASGASA